MTCICCCQPAGACCRRSGLSDLCDQRNECDCKQLGGFYYGPGRTCASVNCSDSGQRCVACCDPQPASLGATVSISGDFLVGNSYFGPGGSVRQYFGLSTGSLTQNVTLTRSGGACGSYSFSGGCTAFGKFRNLAVTLNQSTNSTSCVWIINLAASYLECPLSNALVSQINPCTGEPNLFASISETDSTERRLGCPSGLAFSRSSTTTFSCQTRFFPTSLECWYAPNPSACPALADPVVSMTLQTSLQWSVSIL